MFALIQSFVLAAAVLGAQGQEAAPADQLMRDVPDNHWIYEDLGKLHRLHILPEYKDSPYRGMRPPFTRSELGRYVAVAALNLDMLSSDSIGGFASMKFTYDMHEKANPALAFAKDLRGFVKEMYVLEKYFAKDMPGFVRSTAIIDFTEGSAERLDLAIETLDKTRGIH
jgi:hypothetical protein